MEKITEPTLWDIIQPRKLSRVIRLLREPHVFEEGETLRFDGVGREMTRREVEENVVRTIEEVLDYLLELQSPNQQPTRITRFSTREE